MSFDKGYIRFYRNILEWEWYKDAYTKVVFIHCLLSANWEEKDYKGINIPRGSFITGRKKLAFDLGISEQNVKTALRHLQKTGELTIKSTNKYSVITVVNYDMYQPANQQLTSKENIEQTTTNQQLTTTKELKNIRNKKIKNIYIGENSETENQVKKEPKKFIPPTVEEVREYCKERSNNVDPEKFVDFYASKGWLVGKSKMKDWKASVRTWERSQPKRPKETLVGNDRKDDDSLNVIEQLYLKRGGN